MFFKCLILLFFSTYIEAQYPYQYHPQPCIYPRLDHGRVRVRSRTRLVKFMCTTRYELVGNRYATCRNGQWDVPMPVCVKPGCPDLPLVEHGVQSVTHQNAWVVTFCLPGFKLIGPQAIYCDGYNWNASTPRCIDSSIETILSCDFENAHLCGWMQDELHDFDWKRYNSKTPSSFLNTGPAYDHTLGKGNLGYYMYIESTSKLENDTARLLSPIYDQHLAVDGCFAFFYHMFGQGIGGLRVYQKPDKLQLHEMLNMTGPSKEQYILFEQWGNQGDFWYSAAPMLRDFTDSFQIVIEGIRGKSFTSDIAIDDVAILQGTNCTNFRNSVTTPSPSINSESCAGRCHNVVVRSAGCECSIACMVDDNCCPDFMELCIFDNNGFTSGEADETSPSDEQPQTEKLVGETTTTTLEPLIIRTNPTTTQTTIKSTTKLTTRTTKVTKPQVTEPKTTVKTTKPSTTTKPTTTKKVVRTTRKVAVTTQKVAVTTQKVAVTTQNVTAATQKVTTKRVLPTTKKNITANATPTSDHRLEKKKIEKELNVQKMVADKPVEQKSSAWKTPVITIVVLSVFAALIYLGVVARSTRGRVALARLRGRVLATNDSEVRYLNSTDDDL